MKLKHVFTSLGLALTMALGVGMAVAGHRRNSVEPKEAQALGETYYLVGTRNSWDLEDTSVSIVDGGVSQAMTFTEGEIFKFHTGTTWDTQLDVSNLVGTACGYFDKKSDSEWDNGNIYCKKGGTYSIGIYGDKVSIQMYTGISSAEVYVQVKGWDNTYVYAFDEDSNPGYTSKPLGLYPGTKIDNISHALNFGGNDYGNLGGVGKISVPYLGGLTNTKIIINDGNSNKSGNCALQQGAYYWNDGVSGDTSYGSQAKVVFDIDDAIYDASSESLCNISKLNAASLYEEYESFSSYTRVNESTIWTWTNKELGQKQNWTIAQIAEQLDRIAKAEDPSRGLTVAASTNNTLLIITLSTITVVSLAGLFFIVRRRKHQ